MNKLVILCGLSASGKSTMAKGLAEKLDNAIIVSSDEIRAEISFYEDQSRNTEVFQIFHRRIANALSVGKDVIADATNITIKSRKPIIEIGKKYGAEIMGVLMVTPWIACITRDIGREHEVGEDVIIRQLRKFEVPFMNEGFDKLILSSAMSKNYSEEAFEYFDELMEGFEQDNPHHKDTLDVHCDKVAHRFMQKVKIPRGNSYIRSICLALNIGALYHDIGKTKTKSYDDNDIAHYFHHENVGAYMFLESMFHDTYNSKDSQSDKMLLISAMLINYHMKPFSWRTEKAVAKAKQTFGEDWYTILKAFNECDYGE